MKSDTKKLISVSMPLDLLDDVKKAAKESDMSMTGFIKYVLRVYITESGKKGLSSKIT